MRRNAKLAAAGWLVLLTVLASPAIAGDRSIAEPRDKAERDSLQAARGSLRATRASAVSMSRTAVSYGIGQGSSLVGFDVEQLVANHFGIQVGAGLLGMDAGLTLHFAPGIRTHHVLFGYFHYGVAGELFAGGAVGASLVFRDAGSLTMQLGLGRIVVEGGPNSPLENGQSVAIVSLGICPRR